MAIIAPDGSVLRANGCVLRLDETVARRTAPGIVVGADPPRRRRVQRELTSRMLAARGEQAMVERRYLRPDHSVVHTVMSITLVRDEVGRPLHLVTQVLDVTRPATASRPISRTRVGAIRSQALHNRRPSTSSLPDASAVEPAEASGGALVLFRHRQISRT